MSGTLKNRLRKKFENPPGSGNSLSEWSRARSGLKQATGAQRQALIGGGSSEDALKSLVLMEDVPEEGSSGKGASEMMVIKELVADSSQCMELLKFITDNPSHSVPPVVLPINSEIQKAVGEVVASKEHAIRSLPDLMNKLIPLVHKFLPPAWLRIGAAVLPLASDEIPTDVQHIFSSQRVVESLMTLRTRIEIHVLGFIAQASPTASGHGAPGDVLCNRVQSLNSAMAVETMALIKSK